MRTLKAVRSSADGGEPVGATEPLLVLFCVFQLLWFVFRPKVLHVLGEQSWTFHEVFVKCIIVAEAEAASDQMRHRGSDGSLRDAREPVCHTHLQCVSLAGRAPPTGAED